MVAALLQKLREHLQQPNARHEHRSNAIVTRASLVSKTGTIEDVRPKPDWATHVRNGVSRVLIPIIMGLGSQAMLPQKVLTEVIISAEIQVILIKLQLYGATQQIHQRDLTTAILYQVEKVPANGKEDVK